MPNIPAQACAGALALALSASPQPAGAAFLTAERLALYCAGGTTFGESYCIGYLAGAYDAFQGEQPVRIRSTASGLNARALHASLCPPRDLAIPALRAAFLAWIAANPGSLQAAAAAAVRSMLAETWPCPTEE